MQGYVTALVILLSLIPIGITYPLLASIQEPLVPDLSTQPRFLIRSEQTVSSLAVSPDGLLIAYVVAHGDKWQIWTVRVDSRHSTEVGFGDGSASSLAFSPSGRMLSYVHRAGNVSKLMVVDLVMNGIRSVSGDARVQSYSWSHNSSLLIFDDVTTGALRICNLDRSQVSDVNMPMRAQYPIFGSNDKQIFFSGLTGENYAVWRFDMTTGQLLEISQAEGNALWPQLSPSGKSLLYVDQTKGQISLKIVGLEGENQRKLFEGPQLRQMPGQRQYTVPFLAPEFDLSSLPRWSPDGKYLLFLSKTVINSTNLVMAELNVSVTYRYSFGDMTFKLDLYAFVSQAKDIMAYPLWFPNGNNIVAACSQGILIVPVKPSDVKRIAGYGT